MNKDKQCFQLEPLFVVCLSLRRYNTVEPAVRAAMREMRRQRSVALAADVDDIKARRCKLDPGAVKAPPGLKKLCKKIVQKDCAKGLCAKGLCAKGFVQKDDK